MVRAARKTHSSLIPEGFSSIQEIPNDLLMAIDHASRILDWQENLPEDEMPPHWMWPYEELLNEWFDEVKAKRDEKYGNHGGDTVAPMEQNALAKGKRAELKRG